MKLYAGIDLQAHNSVVVVIDEEERILYQKRLHNELGLLLQALTPYQETLHDIVVESTYNWYWLVDGLMAAGYRWGNLGSSLYFDNKSLSVPGTTGGPELFQIEYHHL
jgi:hypothetical protein